MEVSKKVQDAVSMWRGLSVAEKHHFHTMTQPKAVVDGERARKLFDEHASDEVLLWTAIQTAALKLEGVRLPGLHSVQGHNRAALEGAVRWLLDSNVVSMDKRVKLALFQLAAEATIRAYPLAHFNWEAVVKLITRAVELAYPGYHANDMLVPVAEQVADGKLPPQKEDENVRAE